MHVFIRLYDGEKTGMHAFLHLYDGKKTGMLKNVFTDFFLLRPRLLASNCGLPTTNICKQLKTRLLFKI